MQFLVGEMIACLVAAALIGGVMGWLWTRLAARKRMARLTAEHEHTLSVTEAELQRLSSELAAQNKRVKEAEEAMPALQVRAGDAEARLAGVLKAREMAEAKLRDQAVGMEHLKETLARRDREIGQLEGNINKLTPLVTEVNALRTDAAAWERKSRQAEQQVQAQMTQREHEIAMLRGRLNELEALPAKLVEREARVRDLDLKLRATEAAAQARVQSLENSLRDAEARAAAAGESLQRAEHETARVFEERASEVRALRHRLTDLEAMSTRWAETDRALLVAQTELAEARPLAMAAAVGAGLSSPSAAVPAPLAEPAPLTPAELQGCLQSLLFEKRVQFTPKNALLTPESLDVLAEVAALMDQAPGVPVIIEGHTDNWGDTHTNWHLSHQRAEAVRAELALLGVDERRMSCVGYGETRPVDDNGTPDGRWRNRRIEIRVSPVAGAA